MWINCTEENKNKLYWKYVNEIEENASLSVDIDGNLEVASLVTKENVAEVACPLLAAMAFAASVAFGHLSS